MSFDPNKLRKDFPQLDQRVHHHPLVYFDNAATAQKPQCVINEVSDYYQKHCANINRGAHYLSEIATKKYSEARKTVANFIGSSSDKNIVFTRSTTESINLVASCLGKCHFLPGDEIILSELEHHSNIVPWYLLAKEKQLTIKVIPVLDNGELDLRSFPQLFTPKTKLLALSHASNALGTINPLNTIIEISHSFKVPVLIDGAQAIPHLMVDVQALDVDFYVFSGHKIYGPSGIGVLYAKPTWLNRFPPYQGGGNMIGSVSFEEVSFAEAPEKFEAGTPNIAGALGLAEAIRYLQAIDLAKLHRYETELGAYLEDGLRSLKKVRIIGTASHKLSLSSFVVNNIHPHDLSSIFDRQGIAIRAGHLCAQPLMKRFGINALARASVAFYNTYEEVDIFISAFDEAFEVFKL